MPGVVTTGILAFIGSWNSYLLPLFILNNRATSRCRSACRPSRRSTRSTPPRCWRSPSLSMIPALVFFSLFERRIVGGLTGAVKG